MDMLPAVPWSTLTTGLEEPGEGLHLDPKFGVLSTISVALASCLCL